MVTTTVDPSAKGNFLTFQTFVQLAAIMAAHHDGVFTSRNSKFGGGFRSWPLNSARHRHPAQASPCHAEPCPSARRRII
ncbi:hypothetical protein PCH70_13120 [Pseudomonas cichorii JBC1]|nr:hypothetical protein PCH70_13120 [Pseudomonas cichorii JBC1]